MKLLYRGNHYESISQNLTTVKTEIIACFRGQRYQINRPVFQVNYQKTINLKYRGIPYLCKQGLIISPEKVSNQQLASVI